MGSWSSQFAGAGPTYGMNVDRRAPGRPRVRSHPRRYVVAFALLAAGVALAAPYSYLARAPIRRHTAEIGLTAVPAKSVTPRMRGNVTDHVVVISVDGLRVDALAAYAPPTIQRLSREGATSLTAQTIIPSLTLPSHTSMLTGTEPRVHGITWNTDQTLARGQHLPVPTIFTVAKQSGLRTAAFFSKSKFHHLEHLPSLDYSQSPDGGWGKIFAYRTAEDVERYLEFGRPNLMFVHLGDADYAGHFLGWMSPAYGAAVRAADDAVRRIVAAADRAFGPGQYVVILTADHGGVGRTHGAADPRNRTIPWLAWGERVASGRTLPVGIRTMDTAATALWLLGVSLPSHVVGRPVMTAFRN